MLRRLNLLKIAVIFVTYFGVQLILHEIETIRFLERIRMGHETNQDYFERINFLNEFEEVNTFRGPFEVILVVQVQDSNIEKLSKLVQSLESSELIETALIIFSHLTYDESLNKLIKTIKFARTIQIFFPYSESGKLSKHHFWWTLNHVFDDMTRTADFHGLVVLLKDEHIVSPDFLVVLKMLFKERRENYDSTQLICLGQDKQDFNYSNITNYNKVRIEAWQHHHNILAFDKFFWKRLKSCYEFFCFYDDSQWEFSLENVNRKCWNSNLKSMVLYVQRVFVGTVNPLLNTSLLFPREIEVVYDTDKYFNLPDLPPSHGGWSDPKDHSLCKAMLKIDENDEEEQ